jgi:N-acetylglucosamine-6-phosphate deacetylase
VTKPTALRNCRLATADGLIDGDMLITGERIGSLGRITARSPADERDLGGRILAPGLVDLQVNGLAGAEVYDATASSLRAIAEHAPSTGCTSILPTMMSAPRPQYKRLFDAYVAAPEWSSARMLGFHLEGPYLNPSFRGAHSADAVRDPRVDEALAILRDAAGAVRLWTLAPELSGAEPVIDALMENGVRVAIGHSAVSYTDAIGWFNRGIGLVTHLFNAMTTFHHRDPGLIGATLLHPSVHFSIIADGVHVHPRVLDLVFRLGASRAVLVTDATAAAGSSGEWCAVGGREARLSHGAPRFADGTLAGSALVALAAVQNLAQWTDASLCDALMSMSARPADLLGLDDVGRLAEGAFADILVLTDDGALVETWVGGRVVYRSRPEGGRER